MAISPVKDCSRPPLFIVNSIKWLKVVFFPWGFLFVQSGASVTSQFIEIGIIKNNQSVKEAVKRKVEGEFEKQTRTISD